MKTREEIEIAVERTAEVSMQPGLDRMQFAVLAGIATALSWALEDPDLPRDCGESAIDKIISTGRVWTPEEN
jgi:hypothetical protein